MKKSVIFIALMMTVANAANANAQNGAITDTAQVLSATPSYQTVTSQNCQMVQTVQQPQATGGIGYVGAAIGALAGGLLGHQVGGGTGNMIATAGGSVVGALAGSSVENGLQSQPQYAQQQQCTPVQSQQLIGYAVTYSYNGKQGTVLMHMQPGPTIPVSIVPDVQ